MSLKFKMHVANMIGINQIQDEEAQMHWHTDTLSDERWEEWRAERDEATKVGCVRKVVPEESSPRSTNTPGISVFSPRLYVEFHTKGISDMESKI